MQQVLSKVNRSYWVEAGVRERGVRFQAAEVYGVTVRAEDPDLEQLKRSTATRLAGADIERQPILKAYRKLFKQFQVEGGAMASPEALHRFLAKRQAFPRVNSVVDSYNLKSADLYVVVSAHDLAKVEGDVGLRMTNGNELFYPLGRPDQPEQLPRGEWAGVDERHILCRLNCKQSELSKVTLETTDLLVYVQGNPETTEEYLKGCLEEICQTIVRFNGGRYALLDEKAD